MEPIDNQEWHSLSEQAQQEVYDFFLFVKQRHEQQVQQARHDQAETLLLSNYSANLIEEWLDTSEDEVWQ